MTDFSKPMMSDEEIAIIEKILLLNYPSTCLEWGSGGSTIYFPRHHPYIGKWVSIEHNGKYYNLIKRSVEPFVDLRHVRLEEYLSTVKDEKFDFILIDGLMRAECLMFARDLLTERGLILLHDAGRFEFQKPIKEWPDKKNKLSEGEIEVEGFAHRGLYQFWK